MQGLKCSRYFVDAKPPSVRIIVLQVKFFNALNYGYSVTFIKSLDRSYACIQYIFTYILKITRKVFPK